MKFLSKLYRPQRFIQELDFGRKWLRGHWIAMCILCNELYQITDIIKTSLGYSLHDSMVNLLSQTILDVTIYTGLKLTHHSCFIITLNCSNFLLAFINSWWLISCYHSTFDLKLIFMKHILISYSKSRCISCWLWNVSVVYKNYNEV